MKKIVIFNVGGALASYAEIDNKKILIDLGKSSDFSPITDFLIPLSEAGKFERIEQGAEKDKYLIDQLFLSHLDNDHISDYIKFKEKFHPTYMTCPNDNETQDNIFKIIKNFFTGENEARKLVLNDMSIRSAIVPNPYGMSASNPLVSTISEISIFYINPMECANNEILKSAYANNMSIVLFTKVNDKTLLMPGDILKEGMKYLIERDLMGFKTQISTYGVDYLIAPHHGLQTSFSEDLFGAIAGNKTRLNIISEKTRVADSKENRSEVDPRYYSSDYSTGYNTLKQNAAKTSMGHIVIDFETAETEIKQYQKIEDVIVSFIN